MKSNKNTEMLLSQLFHSIAKKFITEHNKTITKEEAPKKKNILIIDFWTVV